MGCCHAEPINAKLSRAKVKVAHESSKLHPNFIYYFNVTGSVSYIVWAAIA